MNQNKTIAMIEMVNEDVSRLLNDNMEFKRKIEKLEMINKVQEQQIDRLNNAVKDIIKSLEYQHLNKHLANLSADFEIKG